MVLFLDSSTILFVVAILFLIWVFVPSFLHPLSSARERFWRSQTWAGTHRKSWLGAWRGRAESMFNTRSIVHDGYVKYSKSEIPFALPQFNSDPVLVLPASFVQEVIHKSDAEVSLPLFAENSTAARYTGDQYIVRNSLHVEIVKQHLTRKLPLLISAVTEELAIGFHDLWKTEPNTWTSVSLYSSCTKVVSRGANRIFCGPDLCRDPDFLEHTRLYTQSVFAAATVINLCPAWVRPLISLVATYPAHRNLAVCKKIAIPIIKQRLKAIKVLEDKQQRQEEERPNDALQWLLEDCIRRGDRLELDPVMICRRLIRLNMAAIHTTSITITNTILDLYTSPDAVEFVKILQEECERVLSKYNGVWSKAAIGELVQIDSTIKESMRLRSLGLIGTNRVVTQPQGVDFGGNLHVPSGVHIATPIDAIHQDERFYENPTEFDAFRFSRQRGTVSDNDRLAQLLTQKNQSLVTTSNTFLVFGHGRHACPGRFFASQEMKLMLAHIVLNYEVKCVVPRPTNLDIGFASLPREVEIQVKLRPVNSAKA